MAALNAIQDRITLETNQAEIGRVREVLCHYQSKKEAGVYYGRTEQFRLVRIASPVDLIGRLVQAEITDCNKTALVGRLL